MQTIHSNKISSIKIHIFVFNQKKLDLLRKTMRKKSLKPTGMHNI